MNRSMDRSYPPDHGEDAVCGVALDTKHFDSSSIQATTDFGPGQEMLLASFELQPQYCGVFENFSQFVGTENGRLLEVMRTEGIEWSILINQRPLYPYLKLDHIVNPWGLGGFPVSIRLDESATVELVARRVNGRLDPRIGTVGGRITGRYWYNPAYGDVAVRNGFR